MSTAALDRFLYERKADAVALQLEDMACNLSNALDDLGTPEEVAGLRELNKVELLEIAECIIKERAELERAMDRAVDMVWDLVEENRPHVA